MVSQLEAKLNHSLQGLNIVITRPKLQAVKLCEAIKAAGGNAILFPTLEIIETPHQQVLQAVIEELDQYQIAIFTSPNAANKSAEKILAKWPQLPPGLKFAAVGASTAECLREQHLPIDFYPQQRFNSESLLAAPELQQVNHQKIILFSGAGGREELYNTLTQRGAQVTKVAVYQRVKPTVDCDKLQQYWQANALDIIVSTSNESLQNLYDLIGLESRNHLLNTPLLVISERMLVLAKALGFFNSLIVADNASDKAILSALKFFHQNQSHG